MYIRIQDSSIRFRVSRSEADQLLSGEVLKQSLILSPSTSLHYAISSDENENSYRHDKLSNSIYASINSELLRSEIESRPSKQGISIYSSRDGLSPQLVTLEVDLKRKSSHD